jgi:hypothetical protein
MDPETLREHLTKLHTELELAGSVDARSSELLSQIRADIERLTATEPATPADTSLPDRLERIAVQFEAEHPTLAASSRRLVDLLGKVGL